MTTPANDPTSAPAAGNRKRYIIGVIVAAVLIWAGAKFLYGRTHVSTDNAQVDGHITPIAPKVQAFVAEVRVDDNMPVKAGDTLVVLDDRDLRVRLAQMEADLAGARAGAGSSTRRGLSVEEPARSAEV